MTQAQICSTCGKQHPAEAAYCYACGQVLPQGLRVLQTYALNNVPVSQPVVPRHGTGLLDEKVGLAFWTEDAAEPLVVWFTTECMLGRTADSQHATLDLSPFQAADAGVSREHALVLRSGSMVYTEDQDSTNGTFLNGQRLNPYQKRILRNGDTLQLGRLALRVCFIQADSSHDQ